MLCIHNNSLMLNHIFAFTLPEIQDVSKKGTFPDFDVPFPVTGTGMTNSNPIFGNGNGNENSIKFHSLFREREWEWKIPFPTFGTGIGGRYSREFPGSGIPAHGCGELHIENTENFLFRFICNMSMRRPVEHKLLENYLNSEVFKRYIIPTFYLNPTHFSRLLAIFWILPSTQATVSPQVQVQLRKCGL